MGFLRGIPQFLMDSPEFQLPPLKGTLPLPVFFLPAPPPQFLMGSSKRVSPAASPRHPNGLSLPILVGSPKQVSLPNPVGSSKRITLPQRSLAHSPRLVWPRAAPSRVLEERAPPPQYPSRMKPRSGRERMRIVYVNSFGTHRCGSVIQYGGGHRRREEKAAASGVVDRDMSSTSGLSRRRGAPCVGLRGEAGAVSREGRGSPRCPIPPGTGPRGAESCAAAQGPSQGGQAGGAPSLRERGPGLRCTQSRAGGSAQTPGSPALAPPASQRYGGLQMNQADKFGFPFTSKVVNKVIKRKKEKSEVFHGVLKVISKMLEENEKFRGRLLTCSQFNTEVEN
ncbi:uncharacterized protein C5orf47 homolog isoform X4 [Chrysemys picta bellii]|uniref:uncharacterized protein C5orf47 homolog isoform X4 n=1 Tax=Chrysemys picta bellii TaxID=8478 RepID=UPI0032B2BB97